MEDVIRVREIRKSMEQSHFFTPIASPMDQASNNGSAPRSHFTFPSSTPHNCDLYMTLDVSPEEDEPVRRKKSSGGGHSGTPTPSTRVLRNKLHESVVLDDSTTASSINSSTGGDVSASTTPDQNQRRRVHTRKQTLEINNTFFKIVNHKLFPTLGKYKIVEMASASTQTSPGVMRLPSLQPRSYSLRSAQSSTPGNRAPPPVVNLSPDMFNSDGSP